MRRGMVMAGVVAVACVAGAAKGQTGVRMPSEFETAGSELGRLFSYFGGVGSYGTELSAARIHSGGSLRVWANFQHDSIFRVAGFAIGTLGISRPALEVSPGADTFSITIQSPPPPPEGPQGILGLIVTVREDDDNDGVINAGEDDDEWESATIMLQAGTNVYNIPQGALVDTNPGVGNDTRNFAATNRMAFFLTFETRTTFPGGIIETPVSFLIDHVGFYVGAQTIPPPPPPACPPDWNGDGGVNSQDFFDFLSDFFAMPARADYNGDGTTNSQDFFDFVTEFFAGC